MRRILGPLSVSFAFSTVLGCATGYGRMGLKGGYADMQLDATTLRVEFQGNGFTPRSTVETYLLYRCAELTVQQGYDYFVLLSGETEARTGTYQTPGRYSGSAATIGNYAYASGTYTPGQQFEFTKYGAAAWIKLFRGPKPENVGFAAREVMTYLGPRVGQKPLASESTRAAAPPPPRPTMQASSGQPTSAVTAPRASVEPPPPPRPDAGLLAHIATLVDLLKSDDKKLREKAAKGLGQAGPSATDAVGPLTDSLRDVHWGVRLEAAQALGRIGSAANDAVPDLLAMAVHDKDVPAQIHAEKAILKMGSAAVPRVKESLNSSDPRVRKKAASLLKKLIGSNLQP